MIIYHTGWRCTCVSCGSKFKKCAEFIRDTPRVMRVPDQLTGLPPAKTSKERERERVCVISYFHKIQLYIQVLFIDFIYCNSMEVSTMMLQLNSVLSFFMWPHHIDNVNYYCILILFIYLANISVCFFSLFVLLYYAIKSLIQRDSLLFLYSHIAMELFQFLVLIFSLKKKKKRNTKLCDMPNKLNM